MAPTWPFDRRPHARPAWFGRDDDGPEIDAAGWATSPCSEPLCRWLAADALAQLFDQARDSVGLLGLVLAEIEHPGTGRVRRMEADLVELGEAAARDMQAAGRRAGR